MNKIDNAIFEERIKDFLKKQNFMHHIDFQLSKIDEGLTEGVLNIQDIHLQQFGRVHGGVITTLTDVAAGFAAYTMVEKDAHVVTGEIKVSFFAAAQPPQLKVIGKVLKSGRKIVFCEAEVFQVDEEGVVGKLVAKASTSMVVITSEQSKR